ncbi:SET domain-containing protein [Plasmodiophora brassicae]
MLPDTIEVRPFDAYGFACRGLFAKVDMPAGALIWWHDKGTEPVDVYTRTQIEAHPQREKLVMFSYMLGDDQFSSTADPESDPSFFFNHSCSPNTWYDTDERIVAMRDIKAGEQLVYDYSFTETEASLHSGMKCQCGSGQCRGVLTFSEWRSRAFVKRYHGHLTEYIWRKHSENSWYDPRAELRHRPDGALGMFCRTTPGMAFRAGEKILVFSGKVVHRDQLLEPGALSARDWEMSLQVHQDLWQIPAWKESGDKCETTDYVNHSCDPSCGMLDSVTVVAIRDIQEGEEITIDYAMVNDGLITEPSDNFVCSCNSSICRGKITSSDWRIPELQRRYGDYFSPFMRLLIKQQNGKLKHKEVGEPQPPGEPVAKAITVVSS